MPQQLTDLPPEVLLRVADELVALLEHLGEKGLRDDDTFSDEYSESPYYTSDSERSDELANMNHRISYFNMLGEDGRIYDTTTPIQAGMQLTRRRRVLSLSRTCAFFYYLLSPYLFRDVKLCNNIKSVRCIHRLMSSRQACQVKT